MASVLIVALVRIEPPCNAESVSWHQLAQDAKLYEVTDVAHVTVLHDVRSPLAPPSRSMTRSSPGKQALLHPPVCREPKPDRSPRTFAQSPFTGDHNAGLTVERSWLRRF